MAKAKCKKRGQGMTYTILSVYSSSSFSEVQGFVYGSCSYWLQRKFFQLHYFNKPVKLVKKLALSTKFCEQGLTSTTTDSIYSTKPMKGKIIKKC